ncbi:hypothetical protein WISP_54341 [Willisornis vidua]|uniref:Uncharacterized protein n=1 Tax=Willisornis vidua TaxID=1566151 RepID=A0ABQ9DH43_9PASS|nr:hypothetical protein WISP_54341 [Willisornis vidua]
MNLLLVSTSCLKQHSPPPLQGLLALSEATSVPVSIHLDRPIAFSVEDLLLEGSFILATLCEAQKEAASPELGCSSRTRPGSGGDTCGDEPKPPDTSQQARRGRSAPSTDGAKPSSAWAEQEAEGVPRATDRGGTGTAGEAEAAEAPYEKFHSLFFGAVSYKDATGHTFQSLATASDTEEDPGALQGSPAL